ncbi:MAG: glycosyltransferase family 2 protein [Desulfomonilaceae bacterium]
MTSPLVSIVIPTFNRSNSLSVAIDSCLNQTYGNIEIVVVDDGSTDSTPELISDYQGKAQITYIRNNKRAGAQAARIIGIKNARGEYIAFLDSDDVLLPSSVQVRIEVFENSNGQIGLVYGDVFIQTLATSIKFKSLYGYNFDYLLRELSLCPYSVMMIKKDCFQLTGYPDEAFPSWQDDDMVLTIGRHFGVYHCNQPLAIMHPSVDSITSDSYKLYQGCRMIVDKYKLDIRKELGVFRIFLWRLRMTLCLVRSNMGRIKKQIKTDQLLTKAIRISYLVFLRVINRLLTRFLKMFFDNIYA